MLAYAEALMPRLARVRHPLHLPIWCRQPHFAPSGRNWLNCVPVC